MAKVEKKVDWNFWHDELENAISEVDWYLVSEISENMKLDWDLFIKDSDNVLQMIAFVKEKIASILAAYDGEDSFGPVYDSFCCMNIKVWVENKNPHISIQFIPTGTENYE